MMGTETSPLVSRRAMLRKGGAALVTAASAGVSGCLSTLNHRLYKQQQQQQQSARSGPPISFVSEKKRIKKKDATKTVHNRSELKTALKKPDTVVWIPENVTIDMTGDTKNPIAPGVTLASNRNLGKGKGGLIKTTGYDRRMFVVPEGGCRVTGIRLQGPRTSYIDPPYEDLYDYAASGIRFMGTSAIVDNCELWGWTAYAVGLGTKETQTQAWIHHNYAHHCQIGGLGYCVESFNGFALIEWNDLSYYRHAVAGYGHPTNGYEARFNRCGPAGEDESAWAFDMHSLGEQDNFPDSNRTGGKYINVHHNVFEIPDSLAISLSGIPTKYARFCNNWCSEKSIDSEKGAELRIKNNQFGSQAIEKGRQWLIDMGTKLPLSNGKPALGSWSRPTNRRGSQTTSTATGGK